LASAALREYGRINGIMDELKRLNNTVESIRAVLLDADEKQEQSHIIQNWIRRLKDVLIPADDLLDEFVIQDMIHKRDHKPHQKKLTKVLNSFSPNKIAFRRDMAREIDKIQKKFDNVVRDMSGLNLNSNVVVVEKTNCASRETGSYVSESDIIGREDDKKKIISLLRHSHEIQNVSVVAIVGIGGLGKTTLAQLIYNDVEAGAVLLRLERVHMHPLTF
jgi:ABC-type glutathione transport system ATPase component